MKGVLRRCWPELVVAALAVLVCAPFLVRRGVVLVGDMSFVPHQPWKPEWLGLQGGAPRAVPADAVVSLLTYAVPGDLVQKVLLLGALLLAGIGVLRLLRELPDPARLGAAVLYLWNPFVHERLAIGHWGLLVGYGALPWVLRAALHVRRTGPAAAPGLLLWLAVPAIGSPTGGIVAAVVALVVSATGVRRALLVGGLGTLVNLPWLVPALLHSRDTSDATGVEAFAAASDTPLGVAGSLLGLGGIWKQSIVPDERQSLLLSGIAALLTVVALATLAVRARSREGRALAAGRLVPLAVASFLIALVPATGPGQDLLVGLVEAVPGAGLVRDSQKWVLPLALVGAVGFGLALAALCRRTRAPGVALALGLLPLALLPSLAWGLSGELEAVEYPAEWGVVASLLEEAGAGDDRVAVLPWASYRRVPWNGTRAFLDPAVRIFPGEVLSSEDLELGGDDRVRGEETDRARIGRAIDRGQPLAPVLGELGVRWVVVEKAAAPRGEVTGGRVVHDGAALRVIDLGETTPPAPPGGAALIVVVDAVVVAVLLGAAGLVLRRRAAARTSGMPE